jgi:phosphate starvation-inducible protein PhoH
VVRHPLVARIVEAYEAAEKLNPPAARGSQRPPRRDGE